MTGGVEDLFPTNGDSMDRTELASKKSHGYKCVLDSKSSEDSWVNLARWEPAHGCFKFRHPWQEYSKVGAAVRHCAYCVETLHGCVNSETTKVINLFIN